MSGELLSFVGCNTFNCFNDIINNRFKTDNDSLDERSEDEINELIDSVEIEAESDHELSDYYQDEEYDESNSCKPDDNTILKTSTRSILCDLRKFKFPQEIQNEANNIYLSMGLKKKTNRGKCRLNVIFYCLVVAHMNLNMDRDPKQIANMINMPHCQLSKAYNMCSTIRTGYEVRNPIRSPIVFIPGYVRHVGLSDDSIKPIEEFLNEILQKEERYIEDEYPQVIAAAAIQCYMLNEGYSVNKAQYAALVIKSSTTIKKNVERINEIYNR